MILKITKIGEIDMKSSKNKMIKTIFLSLITFTSLNADIYNTFSDNPSTVWIDLNDDNIVDDGETKTDWTYDDLKNNSDLVKSVISNNNSIVDDDISDISSLTNLQYLDLSNENLDNPDLTGLDYLETLIINNNGLSDITLPQTTTLLKVEMKGNQLTAVDFSNNTEIKDINLYDNTINDLSSFEYLNKVENLDLRSNEITNIEYLRNIPTLTFDTDNDESLKLDYREIAITSTLDGRVDIGTDFCNSAGISDEYYLCKTNNFLKKVDYYNEYVWIDLDDSGDETNVDGTVEYKSSWTYDEMFDNIDKIKTIKSIMANIYDKSNLSYRITTISHDYDLKGIGDIHNLEHLELILDNDFTTIPDDFLGFKDTIKTLRLEDNDGKITDISNLSQFTNLTELELYNFDSVSNSFDDLKGLTNLVTLDLRNSRSDNLDFLNNLTNLTYLNLNSFRTLSDGYISDISQIGNLTELKYLNLNNVLYDTGLDLSFLSNLTKLEFLDMDRMVNSEEIKIPKLPATLEFLRTGFYEASDLSFLSDTTNLEYLQIYVNGETDLNDIKNNTNMIKLDIYDKSSDNLLQDISGLKDMGNINYGTYGYVSLTTLSNIGFSHPEYLYSSSTYLDNIGSYISPYVYRNIENNNDSNICSNEELNNNPSTYNKMFLCEPENRFLEYISEYPSYNPIIWVDYDNSGDGTNEDGIDETKSANIFGYKELLDNKDKIKDINFKLSTSSYFSGQKINSNIIKGIEDLSNLEKLQRIYLGNFTGFSASKSLNNLKLLSFYNNRSGYCSGDLNGMNDLFPNLEEIDLGGQYNLTNMVDELKKYTTLKVINNTYRCLVDENNVKDIVSNNSNLEILDIYSMVSDSGDLSFLNDLTNLKSLKFSNLDIDDSSNISLSNTLENIDIGSSCLDLTFLKDNTNLERFYSNGYCISKTPKNTSLDFALNLTKLKDFQIRHDEITDISGVKNIGLLSKPFEDSELFTKLGVDSYPYINIDNKADVLVPDDSDFCNSEIVNHNIYYCKPSNMFLAYLDNYNREVWIDYNDDNIKDNGETSSRFDFNEMKENIEKIKKVSINSNLEQKDIENMEDLVNLKEIDGSIYKEYIFPEFNIETIKIRIDNDNFDFDLSQLVGDKTKHIEFYNSIIPINNNYLNKVPNLEYFKTSYWYPASISTEDKETYTSDFFDKFKNLTNLKYISISDFDKYNGGDFSWIKDMTNLEEVYFSLSNLKDGTMDNFLNLTNLKKLRLSLNNDIVLDNIEWLSNTTDLEYLYIDNLYSDDMKVLDLNPLQNNINLKDLTIYFENSKNYDTRYNGELKIDKLGKLGNLEDFYTSNSYSIDRLSNHYKVENPLNYDTDFCNKNETITDTIGLCKYPNEFLHQALTTTTVWVDFNDDNIIDKEERMYYKNDISSRTSTIYRYKIDYKTLLENKDKIKIIGDTNYNSSVWAYSLIYNISFEEILDEKHLINGVKIYHQNDLQGISDIPNLKALSIYFLGRTEEVNLDVSNFVNLNLLYLDFIGLNEDKTNKVIVKGKNENINKFSISLDKTTDLDNSLEMPNLSELIIKGNMNGDYNLEGLNGLKSKYIKVFDIPDVKLFQNLKDSGVERLYIMFNHITDEYFDNSVIGNISTIKSLYYFSRVGYQPLRFLSKLKLYNLEVEAYYDDRLSLEDKKIFLKGIENSKDTLIKLKIDNNFKNIDYSYLKDFENLGKNPNGVDTLEYGFELEDYFFKNFLFGTPGSKISEGSKLCQSDIMSKFNDNIRLKGYKDYRVSIYDSLCGSAFEYELKSLNNADNGRFILTSNDTTYMEDLQQGETDTIEIHSTDGTDLDAYYEIGSNDINDIMGNYVFCGVAGVKTDDPDNCGIKVSDFTFPDADDKTRIQFKVERSGNPSGLVSLFITYKPDSDGIAVSNLKNIIYSRTSYISELTGYLNSETATDMEAQYISGNPVKLSKTTGNFFVRLIGNYVEDNTIATGSGTDYAIPLDIYKKMGKLTITENNDCIEIAKDTDGSVKIYGDNTIEFVKTCDTNGDETKVDVLINNLYTSNDDEDNSKPEDRTLTFYLQIEVPADTTTTTTNVVDLNEGLILTVPLDKDSKKMIRSLKRKGVSTTNIDKMYKALKDRQTNIEIEENKKVLIYEVMDFLDTQEIETFKTEVMNF